MTPTKFCKKCDICGKDPATVGAFFIDGRTHSGRWADMCQECFVYAGVGLGIGLGQMYHCRTGEQALGGFAHSKED